MAGNTRQNISGGSGCRDRCGEAVKNIARLGFLPGPAQEASKCIMKGKRAFPAGNFKIRSGEVSGARDLKPKAP